MPLRQIIINIFLILVVLITAACGKKIEAGSPEEVIFHLKEMGGTDRVMQLYTDETVTLMDKYRKLTGMSAESATDVLGFIPADAEYEITGKKIEGDTALVTLRFTRHHNENLAGYKTDIKMERDGNSWKIDRSEDLKKLVESYEGKGAENYLKNIR
ncbi:MAG TPA: hypothetical protein PK358_08070 [Spirochaetota bacterium]|nr:hypothetical protein [Spirochaetota bacterium]HPJ34775.1 hypothetical protein [Spirochaetota bacterium]